MMSFESTWQYYTKQNYHNIASVNKDLSDPLSNEYSRVELECRLGP
jgi:hypothetical protein